MFKLAYHAAMGAEHMQVDFKMARSWLTTESASLGPAPANEPLYEAVSPDGSIVRVNLRPFLKIGGNLDSLASAFVTTATLVTRDTTRLIAYWKEVELLAREKRIAVSPTALADLLTAARAKSFPAPGHSPEYRLAYKPAYRLVHRSLFPRLGIRP